MHFDEHFGWLEAFGSVTFVEIEFRRKTYPHRRSACSFPHVDSEIIIWLPCFALLCCDAESTHLSLLDYLACPAILCCFF